MYWSHCRGRGSKYSDGRAGPKWCWWELRPSSCSGWEVCSYSWLLPFFDIPHQSGRKSCRVYFQNIYSESDDSHRLLCCPCGQSHPYLSPGLGQMPPDSSFGPILHSCPSDASKTYLRSGHSSAQKSPGVAPTSLSTSPPTTVTPHHSAPLSSNSVSLHGASCKGSLVVLELAPALALWILLERFPPPGMLFPRYPLGSLSHQFWVIAQISPCYLMLQPAPPPPSPHSRLLLSVFFSFFHSIHPCIIHLFIKLIVCPLSSLGS